MWNNPSSAIGYWGIEEIYIICTYIIGNAFLYKFVVRIYNPPIPLKIYTTAIKHVLFDNFVLFQFYAFLLLVSYAAYAGKIHSIFFSRLPWKQGQKVRSHSLWDIGFQKENIMKILFAD